MPSLVGVTKKGSYKSWSGPRPREQASRPDMSRAKDRRGKRVDEIEARASVSSREGIEAEARVLSCVVEKDRPVEWVTRD